MGLLDGKVAIVTDSAADIPTEEQERLAIHMVSARLNFGETEYIDYVSLQPPELYRMLEERDEVPKTSQPPVGDFVRQYDLLTGHGYEVMSVGVSEVLSGTTQAARTAAECDRARRGVRRPVGQGSSRPIPGSIGRARSRRRRRRSRTPCRAPRSSRRRRPR